MELEHLTTEVEQGRIERGEGTYRKRRNTVDVDGSFFGDNVAHVDSNETSSKEKEDEKKTKDHKRAPAFFTLPEKKAAPVPRDSIVAVEDESEESEEETSRVFLIPKDMQILPRPLKLGKEMVGLLISKHFGDFGWGQGKIKGYNSKRKFPFEIKWSDEPKSRFHQLTLDEYMEGGKEREAKAGDFTIFVKAKEK